MNPRLHVTLHQVIANQLLADDPPETWQTVRRLARLGYDWHNVMYLVMGPVTEAVYETLAEKRPSTWRTTCGGWPSCQVTGRHRRNSAHADAPSRAWMATARH
jgi:Domain of unknown function (DUF1841)